MEKMFLFVFILPLLCCTGTIAQNRSKLPIASHFQPSQLANLTLQEEHQLQLKALLDKEMGTLAQVLILELLAKNSGNEFYGFVDDEKANRECTAVVKAVFDCMGKLPLQFRAESVIQIATFQWIMLYVGLARGHLGKAFYILSSGMDEELKNETIYTTLRDEYNRSESWRPKKIFLYGIPKSENELRIALAQLINEPQTKKFMVNMGYMKSDSSAEEKSVRRIVSRLIKIPGKLEVVQKIYDQVVLEVVSLMPDIPVDKIDLTAEVGFGNDSGAVEPITIFRKLREKINANPDLKSLITNAESPEYFRSWKNYYNPINSTTFQKQ